MAFNVMVDPTPLHSEIPHFIEKGRSYDFKRRVRRFTRTERPVKYYYIDFGISRRYGPDEASPLEDIIVGGDKSVPEFEGTDEPQNPFWTDIYYLGNMIRTDFLEVHCCPPPSFLSSHPDRLVLAGNVQLRLLAAVGRQYGSDRPVEATNNRSSARALRRAPWLVDPARAAVTSCVQRRIRDLWVIQVVEALLQDQGTRFAGNPCTPHSLTTVVFVATSKIESDGRC